MGDYKLIVLPDGSEHEVPEIDNWLSMDRNEEWFTSVDAPISSRSMWLGTTGELHYVCTMDGPFEPGDWTEQLYWIGD